MSDSPTGDPSRGEISEDRPLTEGMLASPSLADGSTLSGTVQFAPSGEAESATLSPFVKNPIPRVPGYEVLDLLGKGGMGIVYRAKQIKANRLVALKMIRAGNDADEHELARFRTEAEAIARLQHPHIVQVFEVGDHEGQPFFSLEYCGGGSLAKHLHGAPLPPREAAQLVEVLAQAVHAAHQKGVIHRDLKPANILLASGTALAPRESPSSRGANAAPLAEWVVKIADFGLAKKIEDAGQTASGVVVGTPSYMAPEQASGAHERFGPATDVYALGAILYELLTGRPPFRAAAPVDTILQVLHDEPVPPHRLQPRTPRDVETICLKCLHKDASRRYATAADLAADLGRWLRGEPIQARPVGWVKRAAKWARRRPALASLLAIAAAVPPLVLLLAAWNLEREKQHTAQVSEINANLQTERNTALEQKDLAERNETRANQREREANEQTKRAEAAQRDSQFRLMQMHVSRGVRLMKDGDAFAALPWLVAALKEDPREAATKEMHRYRIGAILRRSPKLTRMFFHPTNAFNHVEFSADGSKLLTTDNRTVRIWDVLLGKEICPPLRHEGPAPIKASFSPDGQYVATVSGDSKVHIWFAKTGKTIRTNGTRLPTSNAFGVKEARYSPDGKNVLITRPLFLATWDQRTRRESNLLGAHKAEILDASWSRDGRRIVAIDKEGGIGVWDAATRKLLTPALMRKANPPQPAGLRFKHAFLSPDGKQLAAITGDSQLCVWQLGLGTNGDSVRLLWQVPRAGAAGACFSPNGSRIVSWQYIWAKLWDAKTGRLIGQLKHDGQVRHAAFSPDGRWVVTTSEDLTARIWDAATGELAFPPLKHSYVVYHAAFSSDSRLLATACADGAVRVWDFDNERPLARWSTPLKLRTVSPDTRYAVALGASNLSVHVLDGTTGKEIRTPWRSAAVLGYVGFSPDSRYVVACADQTARLWEIASGKETCAPLQHASEVVTAAVNPAATRLATGCKDGTIHVWEVATRKEIYSPLRHAGAVYSLRFSADGRLLLTAGRDSKARVWDAVAGRPIGPFVREPVGSGEWYLWGRGMAWSPDGNLLATSVAGFTAQVWDVRTGQAVGSRLDHSGGLASLMFRPNGGGLLSTSNDCTALQWEVTSGKRLTPAMRHSGFVRAGTYSPDGRRIATISTPERAILRLWDAATGLPLLPPVKLSEGGHLIRLRFAPDGRRLFYWNGHNNSMTVWDVSRDDRSIEDLVKLTNLLSGHQLDVNGGMTPLTRDELRELWRDLFAKYSDGFDAPMDRNERIAWHLKRAQTARINHSPFLVYFHCVRALELGAKDLDHCGRDDVLMPRANAYIQMKRWDKAATDYMRAANLRPEDHWVCLRTAILLVQTNKIEDYQSHRREILKHFRSIQDPTIAERMAKACLLLPGTSEEYEQADQLVERALRGDPARPFFHFVKALVDYRQGHFRDAEHRLVRVVAHENKDWRWETPSYLLLAMVQQRQGQSDKGREALKQAIQLMDRRNLSVVEAGDRQEWHDWLFCQILRCEAEELFKEKR